MIFFGYHRMVATYLACAALTSALMLFAACGFVLAGPRSGDGDNPARSSRRSRRGPRSNGLSGLSSALRGFAIRAAQRRALSLSSTAPGSNNRTCASDEAARNGGCADNRPPQRTG